MNAVTKALNEINFGIPPEVLALAFKERTTMINTSISIDEMIMARVIRPRVLVDCNLVGGIQTVVNLDKCKITSFQNNEFLVDIPKAVINNKSVITALSLVAFSTSINTGNVTHLNSTPTMDVAEQMMNTFGSSEIPIQTARLELIGDNKILVQEPSMIVTDGGLRVMVENDSNMNNLNPRSYMYFSHLCTLAVKAFIYNELIVKLNKGYVYGGHELSTVSSIIESYADYNQMYLEYLENTFKKVSFMNDTESMDRYVTTVVGNML